MLKFIYKDIFNSYSSQLTVNLSEMFANVTEREWTVENFRFYTAVSVMSSARIEGEQLEVDSYVKHKVLNIEYLPNLTEKPNDLYAAYEYARDNTLSYSNFMHAHSLATQHLLPEELRGAVRTVNMLIMEQKTNRITYEAASHCIVKQEFDALWDDLSQLLSQKLSIEETFFYASLIHLAFVKIHPFNDGNGRTARLLEKWFLVSKLGEKAWYVGSENHYYQNLKNYYNTLGQVGLYYNDLDYQQSIAFLMMLPNALISN